MRAADKIVEGLTQLMEGFLELQGKVEKEFKSSEPDILDETDDSDLQVEMDAAMVTEIRATIESVMDAEDYSADELATFISISQDALEEIDPDVFEESDEEDEENTTDVDDDDDIYEDADYEDSEYDDDEEYDDEDEDEDY